MFWLHRSSRGTRLPHKEHPAGKVHPCLPRDQQHRAGQLQGALPAAAVGLGPQHGHHCQPAHQAVPVGPQDTRVRSGQDGALWRAGTPGLVLQQEGTLDSAELGLPPQHPGGRPQGLCLEGEGQVQQVEDVRRRNHLCCCPDSGSEAQQTNTTSSRHTCVDLWK